MAHLLREADVTRLLTMADAVTAVEEAFRFVAQSRALNVPRQRGTLGGATINTLAAVSHGTDTIGVKCYPIVRQDISVGSSFTMLVYKASSGALLGILEADALGQIRTGAASAVATKYLARPESSRVCLFGAGWQARSQLAALACVLDKIERVTVVGRSVDRLRCFCEEMKHLPFELAPSFDPRVAVSEADVVITATGAREPLFDGRWLCPGTHINAMGSNYPDKRELDGAAVQRADLIVVDDLNVARMESGDLLSPDAKVDWSAVRALADVVAGQAPRRTSPDQITLFESQGLGIEDLAVASRVLELAEQEGAGLQVPLV
jgi:ornithine cyclodeaminase/alanine dehydrogenase-like protein (mu-crystallin family)